MNKLHYRSAFSILFEGATDPGKNSQISQQLNPTFPVTNETHDMMSSIGSSILNLIF